MIDVPTLTQFRIEPQANGLIHLVFDCPGRTMNVLSEAAIAELGTFADWLAAADVRGVLIRSGKSNAFCAGADLTEFGRACDLIRAAAPHERFDLAFTHFFPLSRAMRKLETAGKPVAAAIAGLALGGGCELAMAAHYRVLVDDPKVVLGLPESLVGLLPGAGGTQRLPRLIGIEAALPILLEGQRLAGAAARDAGLVDSLCEAGDEIAAAEAWLLTDPVPVQPWDRDEWEPTDPARVSAILGPARAQVLADTLGHYPAPLAILDCILFGFPQRFEGAIRSEMSIFAELIQREEPGNMIQTMFLGKTDYDRLARKAALPEEVTRSVAAAQAELEAIGDEPALGQAGFPGRVAAPVRSRAERGYWIDTPEGASARARVEQVSAAVAAAAGELSLPQRRLLDYAVVKESGFPAYLGGPLAFASRERRAPASGAG